MHIFMINIHHRANSKGRAGKNLFRITTNTPLRKAVHENHFYIATFNSTFIELNIYLLFEL